MLLLSEIFRQILTQFCKLIYNHQITLPFHLRCLAECSPTNECAAFCLNTRMHTISNATGLDNMSAVNRAQDQEARDAVKKYLRAPNVLRSTMNKNKTRYQHKNNHPTCNFWTASNSTQKKNRSKLPVQNNNIKDSSQLHQTKKWHIQTSNLL